MLAGCRPDEPNIIYVTATPEGTLTPTSPPPTETPIPSPTTAPDIVLRIADNYLLNGQYENAVSAYQTVIAQGAPPDLSAAAMYNLGQAALREGLFNNAVDSLTTFITQYPQDARIAQAYFLRGDALLGLSRWAEALTDFQQYLALRPGLIDSYTYERIADAQLALGQFDAALASYEQSATASRTLVPLLALREKIAQIHLQASQPNQAVAQYDAILAVAENPAYRATIDLAAAQALIAAGDLETGLARLQTLFDTYPESQQAYTAMGILLSNGVELDGYAVGRVSFFYGDYDGAIDALNTYTTQRPLADIPAQLHLILGRAYRELGNTDAAVTAFQTIIDQYPQDPAFGEALLEQGRSRFLANDIPGAIERYLFIADNYAYLSAAPEALWRAGYLYGTNNDTEQSRIIFERLATEFPDTDQARSGLFLAASAAMNLNDTARAEQFFSRLAATTTGDDQASAYLWVGRLALQRGDTAQGQEALRLAASAAPDGYFSARAQDLLNGVDAFQRPVAYKFQIDDAAAIAEAEAWLRQTYSITQEGALWPLSDTLTRDARLVRGRELWGVAAYAEADTEFGDLITAYQNDGLASYQLAIFLRGLGAYYSSIVAAANVIRAANVATLDAPAYIARMRYPIYYLDVVNEVANRRNFDPLLLFSLIRHESLFNTYATAAAGEKGLTQVIPGTAEYIAGQIQWPDYQHSDLFRPYAGIEFGAFYLDEQLRRFDGNATAALAGYNAGPGRAIDWLALSGGDHDLFITNITIDSTRGYVQRIYGFHAIYRALYGE